MFPTPLSQVLAYILWVQFVLGSWRQVGWLENGPVQIGPLPTIKTASLEPMGYSKLPRVMHAGLNKYFWQVAELWRRQAHFSWQVGKSTIWKIFYLVSIKELPMGRSTIAERSLVSCMLPGCFVHPPRLSSIINFILPYLHSLIDASGSTTAVSVNLALVKSAGSMKKWHHQKYHNLVGCDSSKPTKILLPQ